MDSSVDHYLVLGLPSGEEGSKLNDKDINKSYRLKALELHPDKRPDDPNAHHNFQKLKTSYEVLKHENTRKLFDDRLRVEREKVERQSQHDAKRRKMISDLEERERSYSNVGDKPRNEEEIISTKIKEEIARIRDLHSDKQRKLKEDIARIRAIHNNKENTAAGPPRKYTKKKDESSRRRCIPDSEKVLKVSWEKIGPGYTPQQLRDLFQKFGGVEDVLIINSRNKEVASAVVAMASKESTVAAIGNVLGHLSNPLLVLPLKAGQPSAFPTFQQSVIKKLMKSGQNKQ